MDDLIETGMVIDCNGHYFNLNIHSRGVAEGSRSQA